MCTRYNFTIFKLNITFAGRNFAAKIALSDHERSECGKQPIYKCNVCDKSYHSAGSLKTHQTVHTGVLAHLCKHCGKAFRTQGQVKVHERSHTGSKPFKCEVSGFHIFI